jgi:hypothetical protein
MQTSGPQATVGVGPRAGSRAGRSLGHPGRRERPPAWLLVLTARVPGDSAIGVGERIMLRPHHDQVHVFSPTTGERLD